MAEQPQPRNTIEARVKVYKNDDNIIVIDEKMKIRSGSVRENAVHSIYFDISLTPYSINLKSILYYTMISNAVSKCHSPPLCYYA